MRGMLGAVVVGSLLVIGSAGSANAQARGYVGIGGGATIPMGDFKDGYKTGWMGQVIGGVTLSDMFGVRVDGGYGQNSGKSGAPKLKLIQAIGDVTLSPKTSGGVAPYLLAGAGMLNSKATVSGVSASSSAFAWNAGVGAKFTAGSLGIYVEGRFLSAKKNGATTNMIPVTVGLRFGGN